MADGKLKVYGIASSTCTGRVLATLFEKGVEDFELKVVNVRKGEGKTPEHKGLQDIISDYGFFPRATLRKKQEGYSFLPYLSPDLFPVAALWFDPSPARWWLDAVWHGGPRYSILSLISSPELPDPHLPFWNDVSLVRANDPFGETESRAIIRYIATKFEGQGTPIYGKTLSEKALVEQWLEVEAQNFNSACKDSLKFAAASSVDEANLAQSLEKLGKVLDIYEARLSQTQFLAGDFISLADLSHLTTGWKLFDKYKKGSVCFEGRPHVKAWWEALSSRPAWKRVLEMI